MFSDSSNDFVINCSIEPISGKTKLKTAFIKDSVVGENCQMAEKDMYERISQRYGDVRDGKISLSDEREKRIYSKLSSCIEKGNSPEKLFNTAAVFAPTCKDFWRTTKESYKKYGLINLLCNNIYTFVFLFALFITVCFSPKTLTGTGYIAVISLTFILFFLALTVFLSSLSEFFIKRSSFIERHGNIPAVFRAEKLHKYYSISLIENICDVAVSKGFLTVKGSVVNKLYDGSYRLIKQSKTDKLILPRIYADEESLLEYLNSLKENENNA